MIDTIYEGIAGESKLKITDELRRFIQAENKDAAKIGDLEKCKETGRVVKPQFDLETYPNARVREGADEPVHLFQVFNVRDQDTSLSDVTRPHTTHIH